MIPSWYIVGAITSITVKVCYISEYYWSGCVVFNKSLHISGTSRGRA